MKTHVYYEAQYQNQSFAGIRGKSIEELKQAIEQKFTYPANMAPENVIYWENQKRNLTFHKVTVHSEEISI